MKLSIYSFAIMFLSFALFTTSCGKDEETITVDSSQPNGTFTVERTGTFTAQSSTPTAGTAEYGKDTDGTYFIRLADNFTTELGTGTVSAYLSTSDTFTADPANGNPDLQLIGSTQRNGEQYFKLDGAISANFTHLILWCNTAGVPFGNSPLN